MIFKSTEEVFDAFSKLNIMVIGDVMIDAYSWGSVSRISPEAPVPIVKSTQKEKRLGGAGNVAKNLNALGVNPFLVSVTGSGNDYNDLIDLFESNKLSTEGLVSSKSRPVTVKERVIGNNQHLLRIDAEVDNPPNAQEEKDIIGRINRLIEKADAVLFEDYDKGTINQYIIDQTISLARKKGIPTVIDPKSRNFNHYHKATTFKPNLKELIEGLGLTDRPSLDQIPEHLRKLKKQFDLDEVIVTLSAEGILAISDDETHHFKAHKRDIADVSGAGDTVVSVIAACKALGLPLSYTTCISNLAGGIVCEQVGVVPVNKEKLMVEAQPFSNLLK